MLRLSRCVAVLAGQPGARRSRSVVPATARRGAETTRHSSGDRTLRHRSQPSGWEPLRRSRQRSSRRTFGPARPRPAGGSATIWRPSSNCVPLAQAAHPCDGFRWPAPDRVAPGGGPGSRRGPGWRGTPPTYRQPGRVRQLPPTAVHERRVPAGHSRPAALSALLGPADSLLEAVEPTPDIAVAARDAAMCTPVLAGSSRGTGQ